MKILHSYNPGHWYAEDKVETGALGWKRKYFSIVFYKHEK
jgi:hypothetical protein